MLISSIDNKSDPSLVSTVLLGCITLLLIFYLHERTEHIIAEREIYSGDILHANIDIATGHLWLEEYLTGDTTIEIDRTLSLINQSLAAVDSVIDSGELAQQPTMANYLKELKARIQKIEAMSLQRINAIETSGIGTEIDQRYDTLFKETQDSFDAVNDVATKHILEEENKKHTVHYTVIILWILVVGGVVAVLRKHLTFRELVESELEESRERYKTVISTIPHGVQECDLNGVITLSNQAHHTILGYEYGELISRPIFDLLALEEEADELRKYLKKLQEEKPEPTQFFSENRRKDGAVIDVQVDWDYKCDSEGKVVGFIAIITDTTERKIAEEGLRQSERIVSSSTDLLTLVDSGFKYIAVNSSFLKAIDKTRDEVVGHSMAEVLGEKYFATVIKPNALRCMAGENVNFQQWFEFPSRGRRFLDINYYPYFCSETEVMGFVANFRDITEKKEAEEILEESERILKQAQNITHLGHWKFYPETCKFEGSEEMSRIFGLDRGETTLEAFTSALHPDDRKRLLGEINESIHDAESWDIEHRLILKDGTEKWVHSIGEPSLDETGKTKYILGTTQDVSERKSLEAHVQNAQKLESLCVLAGGLAHDFNNILMVIIGNTQLALDTLPLESPEWENMEEIYKASKRATTLTKQMLAYSGKGKFDVRRVNLNEVLLEMTTLLESSISKTVTLDFKPGDALPVIDADIAQLHQVVMNLVINASEAIGENKGVVTITTGKANKPDCDKTYPGEIDMTEHPAGNGYVYLEVRDDGAGMGVETVKKIFDPFFTTKFMGRGLGMSATLGIVRGHKGCISVDSEPDKGTTFKVWFPVTTDETPDVKVETLEEILKWRGSGTILLVDDEDQVRLQAEKILKKFGFTVISAVNGKDAVCKFVDNIDQIVCVLLDLMMPVMGGVECFARLREIREDIPVIMVSGYNENDITLKFNEQGPDEYIGKPYDIIDLITRIRKLTENRDL